VARSAPRTSSRRRWRRAPDDRGITFVAFTATPKNKTLELFGTRPTRRGSRRRQPARALPRLFHAPGHRGGLHPRRAAELHALQAGLQAGARGKEYDEKAVERSAALKGIMGWVRLHPYNIAQKVQIVVEHFREHVAPLLGGKAKAMVVVAAARRPCAGSWRSRSTSRSGLQDRHAGRLLGRGERPGVRPRCPSPSTARR
jgi:type I restriction enzyme R subunit